MEWDANNSVRKGINFKKKDNREKKVRKIPAKRNAKKAVYNSEKENQAHKLLRMQGESPKLIKILLLNIRSFS